MFILYTKYIEYSAPKVLFSVLIVFLLHAEFGYAVDDESDPANYAFANYLGSGIYRTSGQDATVVNIPFSYQFSSDNDLNFRLRLPVSLGFFDFDVSDIPEGDIPKSIDTLSFVPGIEFDYSFGERLTVTPYFDLGWGKNLSSGGDTTIYSSGISAFYKLDTGEFDSLWVNRMYYAGYYTLDTNSAEEYAAYQTGIDIGLPSRFELLGRSIQPTVFATSYWYLIDLSFNTPGEEDVSVSRSYELGFTFSADNPIGYSFMSLDRLGVGYRFGKDFYAWHLLFDLPI